MKKILALLLAAAMAFSLVACGNSDNPSTSSKPSTAPTETNKPDEPQGGGEKTTINVIISQYGNYTQEWWTQFEKDFEAATTRWT